MPRKTEPRRSVKELERAAGRLSPMERTILLLSAAAGLRNNEIAARLGLSVRRVERILGRALAKFDRALRHAEPRVPGTKD